MTEKKSTKTTHTQATSKTAKNKTTSGKTTAPKMPKKPTQENRAQQTATPQNRGRKAPVRRSGKLLGGTFMPNQSHIKHDWWIVNASGKTLGRLSTRIANVLRGKHKPTYTPHMDMGDFVIVVNTGKISLTGNKMTGKEYNWYTNYPGGLRTATPDKMIQKDPTEVLYLAVKGMIPHTRIGRAQIKKLRLYAGDKHPHESQNPRPMDV